jgi:hypothetical protein
MNPQRPAPEASFAHSIEREPEVLAQAGSGRFRIRLDYEGTPKGYLGLYGDGWGVMSDTGIVLKEYTHSDKITYYYVDEEGDWKGRYLSVNRKGYFGLYRWASAVGWKFETIGGQKRLRCLYNQQLASFYSDSDQYVYARDDYNLLQAYKEDA